jgi:double-stranded uracil-DNA glycosylase
VRPEPGAPTGASPEETPVPDVVAPGLDVLSGAVALTALVERWRPRVLAVLGVTAWRVAFDRPRAVLGLQPESVGGAATWVVPNPSGLNAHYQLPDLVREFAALRSAHA